MAGAVAGKVGGAVARRVMGAVGVLVVIGVLVGGYFIYDKVANPNHMGQVIYTTDDQTLATDCSTSNLVTTVKTGTHVWAVYMWSHRLSSDQAVVEEDFADGVSLGTYDIPTDKSSDADCLSVTDDLSNSFTEPGTYEIKLTVGTEVVADGKLTITP
jgi:hypothetical protein